MDEYNKYAALADKNIILSCERKQNILHQIKDNDDSFDNVWICKGDQVHDKFDYDPNNSDELAWLGYYIGQSTSVKKLYISIDLSLFNNPGKEVFFRGLGNNRSIHFLSFDKFNLSEGRLFSMTNSFLKDNNLSAIGVYGCQLAGAKGIRQLSLAIGDCNKSLKHFSFRGNEIGDGHLVDIITALSMHPQLTKLNLSDANIGRNECTALATLLRCTATQLQLLNLKGNGIDDEGMGLLLPALRGHALQELHVGSNPSITSNGWERVATLLEVPESKLKRLFVSCNRNVGNDGSLFANALSNNSTLETLSLTGCGVTVEGWTSFSKLLCDTSSVNKTYLSNHTINHIRGTTDAHVIKYLLLNKREDKEQVAMSKILQHHSHFDMQPFFEWEFKVLPLMIQWFTNAVRRVTTYEQKISRLRLSATFDLIKEFPMLYVEPVTRKEITEYTAIEEQLQGGQAEASQLEEIQRCKTRAMRRL